MKNFQNINALNKTKIYIKFALVAFFTVATFIFIYAFYLHNILYVDSLTKSTKRLLPTNGNGNIKLSQEFKLSNYGFNPIKFNMITASCGCTKIDCPKEIKPFSSVKLVADVEYPASILKGKSVDIIIESSAKNSPLALKLISEVGNYYSCSPSAINLGRFYKSQKKNSQIIVNVSTSEKQIPSVELVNDPENLKCEIRETNKRFVRFSDDSVSRFTTFSVDLEAKNSSDKGNFSENLNLLIHGEKDYKMTNPVSWEILPDSSFMLDSYYFSQKQDSAAIILNYDSSSKKIKNISISNNDFKILDRKNFANGLELFVKYNGNPNQNSSSSLTITFEDSKSTATTTLNYILK